jgi:hypothetical protein
MRLPFPRTALTPIYQSSLWLLALGLATTACGDAIDGRPDRAPGDPSSARVDTDTQSSQAQLNEAEPAADAETPAAVCVNGATIACRIPLPTQGNVENCFVGVRTCVAGAWSACHDAAQKH